MGDFFKKIFGNLLSVQTAIFAGIGAAVGAFTGLGWLPGLALGIGAKILKDVVLPPAPAPSPDTESGVDTHGRERSAGGSGPNMEVPRTPADAYRPGPGRSPPPR